MTIVFLIQKNLLPFHHFLKCLKKSYPSGNCTLYPKVMVRMSGKGKRVGSWNPGALAQGPTWAYSSRGGRSCMEEQSSFSLSLDCPVAQRHPFQTQHWVINFHFTSAVLQKSSSGEEKSDRIRRGGVTLSPRWGVASVRWHRATFLSVCRAGCFRMCGASFSPGRGPKRETSSPHSGVETQLHEPPES